MTLWLLTETVSNVNVPTKQGPTARVFLISSWDNACNLASTSPSPPASFHYCLLQHAPSVPKRPQEERQNQRLRHYPLILPDPGTSLSLVRRRLSWEVSGKGTAGLWELSKHRQKLSGMQPDVPALMASSSRRDRGKVGMSAGRGKKMGKLR